MCIVLNNRLNLFFVLVFLAGIIPFCKGQVKGKGMGKNGGNIYLSGNATNSDTFINNMLDKNSQFFNSVIYKPGRSGIQVIYTKIDRTKNEIFETHNMRYLFIPEIKMFLSQLNMGIIHYEEWMTGSKLTDKSWSAVVLAGNKS